MFQKMSSILFFVLLFASITCYDWCPIVAPDGKSFELGITRRWKSTDIDDVSFIMFNRNGKEWQFSLPPSITPEATIGINKGSVREVNDSNVINRFGIWAQITSDIYRGHQSAVWDFATNIRLINEVCLRL